MKKTLLFIALLSGLVASTRAQTQGIEALRHDYPQLMEKFGDELGQQKADYIFAIDVSGTMHRYRETVVPALGEFFRSLQQGDYVSIIKFGGEATNEVGSAGAIGGNTVSHLTEYATHVYDKPTTDFERKRFFNNTDLDNMLHYLADDMKQAGRNDLKFVFIITDFEHDPTAARRGHEDWAGVQQRFLLEQQGNRVYVFALQLPGSARDLERVHSLLPPTFHFNHVAIANGEALSQWFSQRKNAIMLDKFQALVGSKIIDAQLSVAPTADVDGVLNCTIHWQPNAVYDRLKVDTITGMPTPFRFRSSMPRTLKEDGEQVRLGRYVHPDKNLLKPHTHQLSDSLTVHCSFDVPYADELARLGIAEPKLEARAAVDRRIFCYPLPLWAFVATCILLLTYLLLVVRAYRRNRSAAWRLNGRFEVTRGGVAVTERKTARAERSIDFGKGAGWMTVPDCQWALRLYQKTFCPWLYPLKKPQYRIQMTRGSSFKAMGTKWGVHQTPSIARFTNITIDDYRVRWIQ